LLYCKVYSRQKWRRFMSQTRSIKQTMNTRQMPDTRRNILELLKVEGPLTADQMAQSLNITSMGVRQHLVALERDGFIDHAFKQGGKGRPSHVYALTASGDALFPRSYPQLVNSLIEATRQAFGEDGLKEIFSARNNTLESAYQTRLENKTFEQRVAELASIRDEEGYMASWEQTAEDVYELHERNCAICEVAQQCLHACDYELALFKKVLPNANISRERHIMNGDRTCTYVIKKKTS